MIGKPYSVVVNGPGTDVGIVVSAWASGDATRLCCDPFRGGLQTDPANTLIYFSSLPQLGGAINGKDSLVVGYKSIANEFSTATGVSATA